MRYFLGANHCTKICCFCVHCGAPDLIYPGTSLYEHILWMHLEKTRTYACTFPAQRKEINVVKVSFAMRYSSRKLRHEKVITTAYNFWRQIACSFQVKSGNVLLLGKKSFEIPLFFQTQTGDLGKKVHACSLRFSALKFATRESAGWIENRTTVEARKTRNILIPKSIGKDWYVIFPSSSLSSHNGAIGKRPENDKLAL